MILNRPSTWCLKGVQHRIRQGRMLEECNRIASVVGMMYCIGPEKI